MIKKYQKKPVIIEAVQWTGTSENIDEVMEFMQADIMFISNDRLKIRTLEGDMIADPGDYIIKGIKGEFYPCKPDIFEQTYEPYIEVGI